MAFDWKKLQFWKPKEPENPYLARYSSAAKKKTDKKKGNTLRKIGIAGAFGVVAAGGGTLAYNYTTDAETTIKVQSIERIYDVTCKSRVSETRDNVTETNEFGFTLTQRRDVTKELEAQTCEKQPVAYVLHTDKGVFINNPSLLHGKFQGSADKIQSVFEEGATYKVRSYGADIDLPGSGVDLRRNILSAEKIYTYESYRPYNSVYGPSSPYRNNTNRYNSPPPF